MPSVSGARERRGSSIHLGIVWYPAALSNDKRDGISIIFPNEDSIVRLIGAVLLEANDEWQLQHRYMQIEGMAELDAPTDLP